MTLFEQAITNLKAIKSKRNPNNFNIIFFGDSWVNGGHVSDDIFQAAMEKGMTYNPLLVVHCGDGVFSGDIESLNTFVTKVNTLNKDTEGNSIPFFIAPGNHDAYKTDNILNLDNYRQIIGPEEIHFAINLPEFHLKLIGLNSLYNYIYREYGLTENELLFLTENLYEKCHKNCNLVVMHVPPREPELGWLGEDAFPNERGRLQFYEIAKNKASRVLVGHIHDFQVAYKHKVSFILSGGGGAALNVGAKFHIVLMNIRYDGHKIIVTEKFIPVGEKRATEAISESS